MSIILKTNIGSKPQTTSTVTATISSSNLNVVTLSAGSITAANVLSANVTYLGNVTANKIVVRTSLSSNTLSSGDSRLQSLIVNASLSSNTLSSGDSKLQSLIVNTSLSSNTLSAGNTITNTLSAQSFSSGLFNVSQPKLVIISSDGTLSSNITTVGATTAQSIYSPTSISGNTVSAGNVKFTNEITNFGQFISLTSNSITANSITSQSISASNTLSGNIVLLGTVTSQSIFNSSSISSNTLSSGNAKFTHIWNRNFYDLEDNNDIILISNRADFNSTISAKSDIIIADTKQIKTPLYSSGIFGNGYILDSNFSIPQQSFLELDNLRIRGTLRAHIFQKDIVRASNGYLLITDATQLIFPIDNTTTSITAKEQVFQAADIVWIKDIQDNSNNNGGLNVNSEYMLIKDSGTAINSASGIVYTVQRAFGVGTAQSFAGQSTLVRVGSTGTQSGGRTGLILLDASSESSPFIDVVDSLTSTSGSTTSNPFVENSVSGNRIKIRLGQLKGIISPTWGALPNSYGLWGRSVFLEGNIAATAGYIGVKDQGWGINLSAITSTNITIAANSGSAYIGLGNSVNSFNKQGIFLGLSGALLTPVLSLSSDANNFINWNGNKFTFKSLNSELDANGNLNLCGSVSAVTGKIGGFDILSTKISSTSNGLTADSFNKALYINSSVFGNSGIQLENNSNNPRAYIGNGADQFIKFDTVLTLSSKNISIDSNGNTTLSGTISALSGNIGNWKIGTNALSSNNNSIILDSNTPQIKILNVLTAGNNLLTVSGTISSNLGNIGNWVLSSDRLYSTNNQLQFISSGSNSGLYINNTLTAKNNSLTISGTISSNAGQIANWNILQNKISSSGIYSQIELDSLSGQLTITGTQFASRIGINNEVTVINTRYNFSNSIPWGYNNQVFEFMFYNLSGLNSGTIYKLIDGSRESNETYERNGSGWSSSSISGFQISLSASDSVSGQLLIARGYGDGLGGIDQSVGLLPNKFVVSANTQTHFILYQRQGANGFGVLSASAYGENNYSQFLGTLSGWGDESYYIEPVGQLTILGSDSISGNSATGYIDEIRLFIGSTNSIDLGFLRKEVSSSAYSNLQRYIKFNGPVHEETDVRDSSIIAQVRGPINFENLQTQFVKYIPRPSFLTTSNISRFSSNVFDGISVNLQDSLKAGSINTFTIAAASGLFNFIRVNKQITQLDISTTGSVTIGQDLYIQRNSFLGNDATDRTEIFGTLSAKNNIVAIGSISGASLSAGNSRITNLTVPGLLLFNSLSGNNLTANNITYVSTSAIEIVTTGSLNIAGSLDVTGSNLNTFIARFNDSNSAAKVLLTNDGNLLVTSAITANKIGIGISNPIVDIHVTGSISAFSLTAIDGISGSTVSANSSKFINVISTSGNFISLSGTSISSNSLSVVSIFISQATNSNALKMNNGDIRDVNLISINDPGSGEGLAFANTNANWVIDVSPLNRSNADGNLNLYGTSDDIIAWRPFYVKDQSFSASTVEGTSVSSNTLSAGIAKFTTLITENEIFGSLSADGFTANDVVIRNTLSANGITANGFILFRNKVDFENTISGYSDIFIEGDTKNFYIYNFSETEAGIVFADAQAKQGQQAQLARIVYDSSLNKLNIYNSITASESANTRFTIDSSGKIGVGTSSPLSQLHLTGSISALSLTAISVSSNTLSAGTSLFTKIGVNKNPNYNIDVAGIIYADEIASPVKHFLIQHPLSANVKLVHSSLEGPENAVFYRGRGIIVRNKKYIIQLPEYFNKLVRRESLTIYLTPVQRYCKLYIDEVQFESNKIFINLEQNFIEKIFNYNKAFEFDWLVIAERKDIEKLQIIRT